MFRCQVADDAGGHHGLVELLAFLDVGLEQFEREAVDPADVEGLGAFAGDEAFVDGAVRREERRPTTRTRTGLIFAAAAVGALVGSAPNLIATMRYFEHDRKLAAAQVRESEQEILTIEGQVLPPHSVMRLGEEYLSVQAVSVTLKNDGHAPIDLDSIELRAYRAKLDRLVRSEQLPAEIIQVSGEERRRGPRTVAIVDRDSDAWEEIEVLRTPERVPNSKLLRGQREAQELPRAFARIP